MGTLGVGRCPIPLVSRSAVAVHEPEKREAQSIVEIGPGTTTLRGSQSERPPGTSLRSRRHTVARTHASRCCATLPLRPKVHTQRQPSTKTGRAAAWPLRSAQARGSHARRRQNADDALRALLREGMPPTDPQPRPPTDEGCRARRWSALEGAVDGTLSQDPSACLHEAGSVDLVLWASGRDFSRPQGALGVERLQRCCQPWKFGGSGFGTMSMALVPERRQGPRARICR
jgi:hypothetical protein